MSSDLQFIIVPRCSPWTMFSEQMRKICSEFPEDTLVVTENNEQLLSLYEENVKVIQYKNERYLCEELTARLDGKVNWSHCKAIIIPVNDYGGSGYKELFEFAQTNKPDEAYVIMPDLEIFSIEEFLEKRWDDNKRPVNYFPNDEAEQLEFVDHRQKQAIAKTPPDHIMVQLQTVSTCNASCVFCPYPVSWNKKHPGLMSQELFDKIILELEDFSIDKICMYLQNEPFIDALLFDRIEQVKKSLKFRLLEISTNASVLTPEKSLKLADAIKDIPHEIWISFHGINEEGHKEIMGLSYEKTLHHVIEFLKVADKNGLKVIIKSAGAAKASDKIVKAWHYSANEHQEYWKELLTSAGIKNWPLLRYFKYHSRSGNVAVGLDQKIVRPSLENFYCYRIDRAIHISYNGDVVICCNDYHREEILGNLNTQSINELYTSERFQEVRNQVLGLTESSKDFICKRCDNVGG